MTPTPQEEGAMPVTASPQNPLAYSLACEMQIDPDLARLIDARPSLPLTVKQMILTAYCCQSSIPNNCPLSTLSTLLLTYAKSLLDCLCCISSFARKTSLAIGTMP